MNTTSPLRGIPATPAPVVSSGRLRRPEDHGRDAHATKRSRGGLRRAIRSGRLSLGAWVQIGHPASAEILAHAGFDWVCVDLEHGAIGIETMADIFRAVEAADSVPMARLPANDPIWIHRSLDAGAGGLIIPRVNTAEQAEAAVREAKYPPRGRRGFGYARANQHGARFDEYRRRANDEIALVVQIEHKDAIENLEGILQVDGVDAAFIGPFDLSGSMGIPGQLDHPDVRAALRRFLRLCRKHKVTAGYHVVRPDAKDVRRAVAAGYTLIALGVDTVFIQQEAARALAAARATL